MGIIASYWLEEPRGGVGDEREQMTSFLADLVPGEWTIVIQTTLSYAIGVD